MNTVPEPLEETSSSQLQNSFDSKNKSEIDRRPAKIEIHTDTDSHFSFQIDNPLSIMWKKHNRCFVLKCPFSVKMENCEDIIAGPTKNSPRLARKSKILLKSSGLNIEERHEILFHVVLMHQHAGIFEKFHIKVGKGITLSFTKKAIERRVTIQKGVVLGDLCTLAQLNE